MTDDQKKRRIRDYINTQILGVISTVNEQGKPESALIAVTETENLEIFFGTYSTVRKYKNLQHNPHVSIVIGHDIDERITVQYEGVAKEVIGDEAENCKKLHLVKNPRSKKYAAMPEQRWFKIRPTWIRYSDLNAEPQVEFEVLLRK